MRNSLFHTRPHVRHLAEARLCRMAPPDARPDVPPTPERTPWISVVTASATEGFATFAKEMGAQGFAMGK